MMVDDILQQARDGMEVRRVFGEPIEKNGITVIPAARVSGGAGGGSGSDDGGNEGGGGGFGLAARPVGAFKIDGDQVTWVPAVDVTRIALMGQVVAVVALLVIRSIVRRRRRRS